MNNWSKWKQMPSPVSCRIINAPEGSGVYQIRNRRTKVFVQFGIGGKCRERMKSLFPKPYGVGTRKNEYKRKYILENWKDLEFRTLETETIEEAKKMEYQIKSKNNHIYNT